MVVWSLRQLPATTWLLYLTFQGEVLGIERQHSALNKLQSVQSRETLKSRPGLSVSPAACNENSLKKKKTCAKYGRLAKYDRLAQKAACKVNKLVKINIVDCLKQCCQS